MYVRSTWVQYFPQFVIQILFNNFSEVLNNNGIV